MNKQQLEICFETAAMKRVRARRRPSKARFWFGRMRQAVNQAFDWTEAPEARPQQIYLSLVPTR